MMDIRKNKKKKKKKQIEKDDNEEIKQEKLEIKDKDRDRDKDRDKDKDREIDIKKLKEDKEKDTLLAALGTTTSDEALKKKIKKKKEAEKEAEEKKETKFTIEDFGQKFDTKSLINKLTRDLLDMNKEEKDEARAFDPSNFQKLLDNSIQQLKQLREQADQNINQLVSETKEAEEKQKQNLANLNGSLTNIFSKFRRLDLRISTVSHTAVRIGHTLETVDQQKRASIHGKEIIQHFLAFNTGDKSKLDPVFTTDDPSKIHQAAQLIQTLNEIVQDLRVKGIDKALELIAKTSSQIENVLLDRFEAATNNSNISEMKACARTLLNFRGGSVIQRYVFRAIQYIPSDVKDDVWLMSEKEEKEKAEKKEKEKKKKKKKKKNEGENEKEEEEGEGEEQDKEGGKKKKKKEKAEQEKDSEKGKEEEKGENKNQEPKGGAESGEKSDDAKTQGENVTSSTDGKPREGSEGESGSEGAKPNTGGEENLDPNILVTKNKKESVGKFTIPELEQKMTKFCLAVTKTCEKEFVTISRVFPNGINVVKSLLERIFADKVQGYVDSMLIEYTYNSGSYVQNTTALVRDPIAEQYLQTLYLVVQQTETLVDSLNILLKKVNRHVLGGARGERGSVSGPSGGNVGGGGEGKGSVILSGDSSMNELGVNLKDQMNGIFVKYRQDYLSRELKQLNQVCTEEIRDALEMDITNSAQSPTTGRRKKPGMADIYLWIQKVLEDTVIERLIDYTNICVTRCDKLSDATNLPENVHQMFIGLLTNIIEQYVKPILSKSEDFLPELEPKVEPDTFFLGVIRSMDQLFSRLDRFYQNSIVTRIANELNTLTICEKHRRDLTQQVERRILLGLSRCLDAAVNHGARILAKQKANDYKPKDEGSLLDLKPSKECRQLGTFISHQYEAVFKNLEGKNLDRYLTLFGKKTYDVIANHLKKFQVSPTGAGILTRDIQAYQRYVRESHISSVNEMFEKLRVMANMFFVAVENLAALLEDQKFQQIDKEELHDWLKMRTDYVQHRGKILSILETHKLRI